MGRWSIPTGVRAGSWPLPTPGQLQPSITTFCLVFASSRMPNCWWACTEPSSLIGMANAPDQVSLAEPEFHDHGQHGDACPGQGEDERVG